MSLSLAERESIVRWSQVPGEPFSVYTHDRALIRDLEKRGLVADEIYRNDGVVVAKHFSVPRGLISIKLKRVQSPAERAAALRKLENIRRRRAAAQAVVPPDDNGTPATSNPSLSRLAAKTNAPGQSVAPKTDSRPSPAPKNGGCTP